MKTYSILITILVLTFGTCLKAQNEANNKTSIPNAIEEITLQAALPFKVGAAVNINLLKNKTVYRELVNREFNSLTAENAMKFSQLHPAENEYKWAEADELMNFAQQYHKRVHGHTLIWYRAVPDWVLNYQGDALAWGKLLKDHIQTVVGRYKGKITSWDVVNEAITDKGELRDCIWLQKLGPEYIDKSFIYAHQADPDALLFYNDYGHEYSSAKRKAINELIANLKQKGVPIHGIGMQMHINRNTADANLATAITTAVATGLLVHISELDIAMNSDNIQWLTYNNDLAAQQKAKYKFVVQTYNAIPKKQQFGITTWNVTDADTWITSQYNRPDWPLPFDNQYQKKAAYQGIIEGIK